MNIYEGVVVGEFQRGWREEEEGGAERTFVGVRHTGPNWERPMFFCCCLSWAPPPPIFSLQRHAVPDAWY